MKQTDVYYYIIRNIFRLTYFSITSELAHRIIFDTAPESGSTITMNYSYSPKQIGEQPKILNSSVPYKVEEFSYVTIEFSKYKFYDIIRNLKIYFIQQSLKRMEIEDKVKFIFKKSS